MILHGYYRSSAAYRVRIALNLKGLPYETVPHHLRYDGHLTAAYRALNPQALVPALEVDGRCLTQSLAIIEYLDEVHPTPPLLPNAAIDRAYVRSLAQIIASDIHPINNLRVLRYLRGPLGVAEPKVLSWYRHWIAEGFTALEAVLRTDARTSPFCCGDQPSLADICLVPQLYNARNFNVELDAYPTLLKIEGKCQDLASFAEAHPARQLDAE